MKGTETSVAAVVFPWGSHLIPLQLAFPDSLIYLHNLSKLIHLLNDK